MAENRNIVASNFSSDSSHLTSGNDGANANWGANAKRSMYHVTNNLSQNAQNKNMGSRNLLSSRLWHGVPQLTVEQMSMFEAAYMGHTFIFVVDVPKFMTDGLYKDTNMHQQMKNLKAVIERASTSFDGAQNILANNADQEDGAGRKVSHIVSVTKDQGNIMLRLHEFAGLPVKNACESWLTGIYDYRSQHGNYHGNLGIKNGWCLANHTMSILVVQVTPDWTTIQDAAFYYNMVPTEVPFDHFDWTKGEQTIVEDYNLEFYANEERSPAIMYAAEKYMNNRVLSMVGTSVYNSRQFVVKDFGEQSTGGFTKNITTDQIIDKSQFNQYITNDGVSQGGKGSSMLETQSGVADKSLTLEYVNADGTTNT